MENCVGDIDVPSHRIWDRDYEGFFDSDFECIASGIQECEDQFKSSGFSGEFLTDWQDF